MFWHLTLVMALLAYCILCCIHCIFVLLHCIVLREMTTFKQKNEKARKDIVVSLSCVLLLFVHLTKTTFSMFYY